MFKRSCPLLWWCNTLFSYKLSSLHKNWPLTDVQWTTYSRRTPTDPNQILHESPKRTPTPLPPNTCLWSCHNELSDQLWLQAIPIQIKNRQIKNHSNSFCRQSFMSQTISTCWVNVLSMGSRCRLNKNTLLYFGLLIWPFFNSINFC